MKNIGLHDSEDKFKKGEIVALSCTYSLFKVIKNPVSRKTYLEFVGISDSNKACSCDCCTIGVVGSGIPIIPNNSENCKQYKFVMRLEKRRAKK